MLESQRLDIRASEIRSQLASASTAESADHSLIESLSNEYRDVEAKRRAAMLAEDVPETATRDDSQGRELRGLIERASVLKMLGQHSRELPLDGAEAEVSTELGASGGEIPFELLETRADASTSTTVTDGPQASRGILRRIFGGSVSEYMGVNFTRVPPGRHEWTLITGGVAPASAAESASRPDSVALAVTQQTLKPARIATGAYRVTSEFLASNPGAEAAVRDDLRMAVQNAVDSQVLNGDGTGANAHGFLSRLAAPGTLPTQVPDADDYLNFAAGGIDGLHAQAESDVRLLMGVDAYKRAATVLIGDVDTSTSQLLSQRYGGLRSTVHLTVASNVSAALTFGRRAPGASVAAMWGSGITMLRDPYTRSAQGEVLYTGSILAGIYTVLRAGAYTRGAFYTA